MMTKTTNLPPLPKLPFGQGSYAYQKNGSIVHKKTILLVDGKRINKSVTGWSVKECNKLMQQLELKLHTEGPNIKEEQLSETVLKWLVTFKEKTLKPQSYARIHSVYKNHLLGSELESLHTSYVTPEQIQSVIDKMADNYFSKSSIKKLYDLLNEFYRYYSERHSIKNPMKLVKMPVNDFIKVETKQIQFFDDEDIKLFVEEAGARYNTGTYKYRSGYALAANIYLGLRMGELLALQWKDIDFERKTIYISKTLIQINNPEYDPNDKPLMRKLDIHRVKYVVQHSTKRNKNRYVPVNNKAHDLLMKHYKVSEFHDPDDYVINTRNRKTNTIKNISDTIKAMELSAGTRVQAHNTHILRHTCASLYFRHNVPIETICQILGNTREVCEATYVHFIEEQLKDAASRIEIIQLD